jgi:Putative MetA-pathway of phenol degradation
MAMERQRRSPAILSIALAVGAALAPAPAKPAPQDAAAAGNQGAKDESDADNNGTDITRPENSFDARFQVRTSSGTSSSGAPTSTVRDFEIFRLSSRIELNADWKLGVLAQLPILAKTTTTENSSSGPDYEFGIGNAVVQAFLARKIDERWAFGFGARLVAPTAADSLGSGKWEIMPGFGVRYALLEFGPDTYFVPVIRYAISFAGDPSKRNISEPQIAPTLNIGLPDHWFMTFYPSNDIRINYGDPISGQTGRLFLPFDVAVGRKVADRLLMSLEVSVPIIKDYPVYNFKTEMRFVVQF